MTMRIGPVGAAVAVAGCGLFVLSPLAAWADVVPAPPGSASSTAVSVGSQSQPILTVSSTSAQASKSGASSGSTVIGLEGHPVLSTGGQSSTSDRSSASGSLVSTAQGPANAQVAPYEASSSSDASGSRSASGADVATANVGGDSGISASLVDSHSTASYTNSPTGGSSAGETSTCGACIDIGGPSGLDLQVLYADALSNGQGHVWLVSVNNTPIGTSTDGTAALCEALTIPDLLGLDCLKVSGGVGHASSHVAVGTLGGSAGLPFAAFTAQAGQGSAGLLDVPAPPRGGLAGASSLPTDSPDLAAPPAPESAPAGPSGSLPFTGARIGFLAAAAAALLALGAVTLGLARCLALRAARL